MCLHIIFGNLTQTRKHRLNNLLLTHYPQCQFHYISSHLPVFETNNAMICQFETNSAMICQFSIAQW